MNLTNKILVYSISILTFSIIMPYISNSTLEEVQKSFQEVAYSYYMRGKYIQYHPPKDCLFPPEDATEQNINYLVPTSFTMAVYLELLNVTTPYDPIHYFQYVNDNWGSPEIFAYIHSNEDNEFEMKFYSPTEKEYKTITNPTLKEDIIPKLQIGDILITDGDGILIYDLVKDDKGGVIDAFILYSTMGMGRFVNSKIHRNRVNYPSGNIFSSGVYRLYLNNILNSEEELIERTIDIKLLSEYYGWAKIDNPLGRNQTQYGIFRILNEDSSGNSILNYKNIYTYYINNFTDNDIIELSNKNKDRAKFKHLYIDKTVDKKNNNIVDLGDLLTYKIIIKNKGEEDYNQDLIVTEKLSEFVTFKSHKENKEVNNFDYDKENRTLIWNIGKLKKGDEYIIEYTVNVTNGKPKDIIENKGFVGNIDSSKVKNIIGNNLKEKHMNAIKTNYEKLKEKHSGKNLINEIYKQSFGVDIKFDQFDITNLVINDPKDLREARTIYLNNNNPFYNEVLNKYYSALATIRYTIIEGADIVDIYSIKEYQFYLNLENLERREDFIYKEHFKTGDILIYKNNNDNYYYSDNNEFKYEAITFEEGEYAYIYIEGKGFVGVNLGDDGIKNTKDDRNEFNAKYYEKNNLPLYIKIENATEEFLDIANYQTLFGKDYYAILRPSLCFDFPNVIEDKSDTGNENENENENKSYGLIIFLVIFFIIILIIGLIILWKYLKLRKSGKEFNFKNLREQPLLG